jgi:AsmA-like protein
MARRHLTAAVAVGAALALLGAAALVSFDASTLGRAVLQRGAAVLGGTLTARSFRLRPLTGLSLEGLEGSLAFTGGTATVSVERLVLDHRLGRLLLGELAVDRLVLQRPRVRLVESTSEARVARPRPAAAGLGPLALRISRIDVEDGTLELQAPGQARPMVVSGFSLKLRDVAFDGRAAAALAGLSGAGEVRAARVAFARSDATDVSGSVRVGGGRLSTGAVRFQTPQGPFQATLDARLDKLPLSYTLALRGEPLNVGSMMTVSSAGTPGAPGAGALQLDARGVGTEATGLVGRGVLRLSAGTLPATPLLQGVERALGRTRLVGAAYEATEAPFRIEGGRVLLDDFQLRTGHVGLDVAGWASLQGPLELTLAIHAPREGLTVEGVAAGALDLMTDDQGRVVVPLKVVGTQEQPRVRPDVAALAAQARRGGARTLLEKAGRGLGGLLRRKPRE